MTNFDLTPPDDAQRKDITAGLDRDEKRVLLEHGTEAAFALRQSSGPRLPRRPQADRRPPLPQLRLAELHRERSGTAGCAGSRSSRGSVRFRRGVITHW